MSVERTLKSFEGQITNLRLTRGRLGGGNIHEATAEVSGLQSVFPEASEPTLVNLKFTRDTAPKLGNRVVLELKEVWD